jgi:hypothetical protein
MDSVSTFFSGGESEVKREPRKESESRKAEGGAPEQRRPSKWQERRQERAAKMKSIAKKYGR